MIFGTIPISTTSCQKLSKIHQFQSSKTIYLMHSQLFTFKPANSTRLDHKMPQNNHKNSSSKNSIMSPSFYLPESPSSDASIPSRLVVPSVRQERSQRLSNSLTGSFISHPTINHQHHNQHSSSSKINPHSQHINQQQFVSDTVMSTSSTTRVNTHSYLKRIIISPSCVVSFSVARLYTQSQLS